MVGWTMYRLDAVKVTKGTPKVYASSEHGRRHFCPNCGTGLFYTNEKILPGIVDEQWPSLATMRTDVCLECLRVGRATGASTPCN